MYSVIGLGQAGSNVATEAEKRGVKSGAINFSERDLDACNVSHKLHLSGSEGVGKQRKLATELFMSQYSEVVKFIRRYFFDKELIVLSFAASGGTGSGLAPILIDVLQTEFPNKVFLSHIILPAINESFLSHRNTLETINELMKIDGSFIISDNEYYSHNHYGSREELLQKINVDFIEELNRFISYTNKTSSTGNFDQRDMLTVLNKSGLIKLCSIDPFKNVASINLTEDSISKSILSHWEKVNFPLSNLQTIDKAVYINDNNNRKLGNADIYKIFESICRPSSVFEGYYHENNLFIMTLITGLSWNQNRFRDIQKSLKTYEYHEENFEGFDVGNRDAETAKQKLKKKVSALEILSKYN